MRSGISILLFLLMTGCASSPSLRASGVLVGRLIAGLSQLETRGFAGQLVVVRGDEVMVRRGFGTVSLSDPR